MKRISSLLVILLLAAACQKQTEQKSKVLNEAAPEEGGFSSARLARLDSSMNDWVKKKWVNGSVALVARNRKIVFINRLATMILIRKLRWQRTASSALPRKPKPSPAWP